MSATASKIDPTIKALDGFYCANLHLGGGR
jgi:hypothetical protein